MSPCGVSIDDNLGEARTNTCGRCRGEIELRSVGDNYLTGKPIMRWRRVDRPKIGCPENPAAYCYPVTKETPYHARIL